jgi:hypothetical protein
LLGVLLIVFYNRLVGLRNMVREGWSGIDVQLKRRANLIPNLVETVKGYMGHERDILEKVTELRSRSMQTGSLGEKQQVESALSGGLARLFAVAEGYPELKAALKGLRTRLGTEYEKAYFLRNTRYFIPGMVISLLALGGILLTASLAPVAMFMLVWLSGWSVGV